MQTLTASTLSYINGEKYDSNQEHTAAGRARVLKRHFRDFGRQNEFSFRS